MSAVDDEVLPVNTLCFSLQKEVLQTKKKICFVLLSAPWSVLCYYAEEISLRVPLQVKEITVQCCLHRLFMVQLKPQVKQKS